MWVLPVLPAQDLPQHLAYARVLMDHVHSELPFAERFVLPNQFQSYFTTHYLLAYLARLITLRAALRVLMTLYVIGIYWSFARLCRSHHPGRWGTPPIWEAFAATLLVWSPVACLGFLPFMLAVPVFFAACAFLLDAQRSRTRVALSSLIVCAAALALLHAVAAGAFVAFVILLALFSGQGRAVAAVGGGTALATFVFVSMMGESGLGISVNLQWSEAIQRAHGLEFITEVFRIKWDDAPVKLRFILWVALGPFSRSGQLLVAIVLAVVMMASRVSATCPSPVADGVHKGFSRATVGFAVVAWLMPWGLNVPTEVTFLDIRFMTLSFGLLLALVNPAAFSASGPRLVVTAGGVVLALH
jgi:hypothetical protein